MDKRGHYCNGHKLSDGFPGTSTQMLNQLRFIQYADLKSMFEKLREDGKDLIDELRRDISARPNEIWSLLHEDDRALIVRYFVGTQEYRWGWVLQRQEDKEYKNPIDWSKRIFIKED